ncbi:MAG: hypothetical protein ACREFO_00835 [Acetobacteraceae bacterium]
MVLRELLVQTADTDFLREMIGFAAQLQRDNLHERAHSRAAREDVVTIFGGDLLSAAVCLNNDFEARSAHLRFALEHRRVVRTTNLLERLFGEERHAAESSRMFLASERS